jgi:hypothetical protein
VSHIPTTNVYLGESCMGCHFICRILAFTPCAREIFTQQPLHQMLLRITEPLGSRLRDGPRTLVTQTNSSYIEGYPCLYGRKQFYGHAFMLKIKELMGSDMIRQVTCTKRMENLTLAKGIFNLLYSEVRRSS